MMFLTEELQTLQSFDYWKIAGIVIAGLALFSSIGKLWEYFIEKTGITTKRKIRETATAEMITRHDEDIVKLRECDKNIEESVRQIAITVENLNCKIDRMQDKIDSGKRAQLKDRIGECYRQYHERGSWTAMEREAFNDLVKSYEHHGGTNSFVHDICLPESYTWKVVS